MIAISSKIIYTHFNRNICQLITILTEKNIMRYKKTVILAIILVTLLAVSAVSAADNATDDIISAEVASEDVVSNQVNAVENGTDNSISVNDDNQVITEGNDSDVGSFDELQTEINNVEEGGVLNLTKDYEYVNGSNKGILISKPITINGNGHVLDAKGQTRIFNINSDNVTLKNITFINAGQVDYGAAVYSNRNNLSIMDSSFINNSAMISGGAVYVNGDSFSNRIINCNFERNTAKTSGGAFECIFSELLFDNVTFTYNRGSQGAGVTLQHSICIFTNCLFDNNEAEKAAGAIYAYYAVTSMDNCEVTNNRVSGKYPFGGAIAYFAFENNISNTIIRNNSITGDYGYGSSIYNYGRLNINNSRIVDNKQKTKNYIEETIFTNNGKVNLFNNTFMNNTVESENESTIYTLFWPLVFDEVFDENTVIPSSLDLRTIIKKNGTVENQFKPIQNQGNSGGCWAFSATSIMEYYFKSHYDLKYEFSENNLINVMGPYGKNGWTAAKGGATAKAVAYWSRWSGPVMASDDPFNESSKISPENLAVWGHLQDVVYLTCGDITQLKLAVLEYGPVVVGYKYYDPEVFCLNGTYFESGASPINFFPKYSTHLVSIVGWDDNYPGSKFGEGIPDGAFLIRNSFGVKFFNATINQTVYLEDDGYNWISYYDLSLSTESTAYAIANVEGTDNYNHNYQYDLKGTLISLGYNSDTGWFANQFKATDNSPMAAFSLYTYVPNSTYEAYIYVNDKLSYTQKGSISNPGYNTIKLNRLVDLNKNDIFRIAIKLTTPGFVYPIPLETADSSMNTKTSADLNQSFVSPDGVNWYDISQTTGVLHMELGSLVYKQMNDTNVCLKAFTVKLNTKLVASAVTTVYNGGKYLIITLKDSQNNPIGDETLTINLNGVKTVKTNGNGQAKLTTDGLAPVKTYVAKITFKGNSKYEKSTKSVKVYVKKANLKVTPTIKKYKANVKAKKYYVTVKNSKNQKLKNIKVSLTVKGRTFSAYTLKNGVATLKVTNLLKKGTYKAYVSFAGSKYYNKLSKKVYITVK